MDSFATQDGLVYFSSNQKGSHVVLFGPRGRLPFRNDSSKFDDLSSSYTWAFEYTGAMRDGAQFVFATSDRTVVGEVVRGKIEIVDRGVRVVRDADSKPLRVNWPHNITMRPMIAHPKVSILTCTYNRPGMLKEAVQSMQAQTEPSWEQLICDDASTNSDVEKVLDELSADPRVRIYRKLKNVNQPARYWNELMDRARGQYIGFLDDDNLKHPRFIETLSAILDDDSSVDMVTCGWIVVDKDGSNNECHLNLETSNSEIEKRSTIDTGAFLIRREALERCGYFPHNIRTNEDWAMMRRAVPHLNIAHLPDSLATYRAHAGQRMEKCEELGNSGDQDRIRSMVWSAEYGVRLFQPTAEKLTASQRDVVSGVEEGLKGIPWIEDGSDLAILIAPFQMDLAEVEMIALAHHTVVSLHMEDPYALHANLERIRAVARFCDDPWVCSNDTTCASEYEKVVGRQFIVCPSLSARTIEAMPAAERLIEVALVGYAYPSRVKFVRELGHYFNLAKLQLVGDGWREAGFPSAWPTMSAVDTTNVYARSKAIICLHRVHGDCVDGPFEPKLAARGYVEGAFGARVFLDVQRSEHPFENGEVAWYGNALDLAEQLHEFLALPKDRQVDLARGLKERTALDFTYRTRIARVVNAVRSGRFEAVIP